MKSPRQTKLALVKAVFITKEAHKKLRNLKKKLQKSMAQIIIDCIEKL